MGVLTGLVSGRGREAFVTRFDSAEHLYDWQRSGRFPNIHDGIYNLIRSDVGPADGTLLDLGSSTGLLTRRLGQAGFTVLGVEADANAIEAGRTAGTYSHTIPVRRWVLTPNQLDAFGDLLRAEGVTIVVARRVIPELDDAGVTPPLLAATLANSGVRHLFVEGRAPRRDASHRLRSLAIETAELGTRWQTATVDGSHRVYLTVKE